LRVSCCLVVVEVVIMGSGALWRVVYEVRQQGSIGAFEHRTVFAPGELDLADAVRFARERCGALGWETRQPFGTPIRVDASTGAPLT
jgi:hypothetical protein